MEIETLDRVDTEPLRQLYHSTFADVPYVYPVSSDEFKHGLLEPSDSLCDHYVISERKGGDIAAYADVATWLDGDDRWGVIRALCYGIGDRATAQSVLQEAESHLFSARVARIYAFTHSYDFYRFAFSALTEKAGHVCGLMGANDYDIIGGWRFMHLPDFEMSEPAAPHRDLEIEVQEVGEQSEGPNVLVHLMQERKQIGEAKVKTTDSDHEASTIRDTFYIEFMGIEESHRGRGLGRYLLQTTLWEMNQRGYKTATLHTNQATGLNYSTQTSVSGSWTRAINSGRRKTDAGHRYPLHRLSSHSG